MATNMLNLDETAFGRVRRFVQRTPEKTPDAMYTDFLREGVTQDLAKSIEWQTRGRETNPVWQEHCRGMLMADSFYRVLSRANGWRNQPEHRQVDLINHVAYCPRHLTPVLSWEEMHKEAALTAYWRHIAVRSPQIHATHELRRPGLFISQGNPLIGASPDAMVYPKNIEVNPQPLYIVMVRCPYDTRNGHPEKALPESVYTNGANKRWCFVPDQDLYMRGQVEMLITGTKLCDVVIYTTQGIHVDQMEKTLCPRLPSTRCPRLPLLVNREYTDDASRYMKDASLFVKEHLFPWMVESV